jgi:site-specific DNA-methyltransferase (adenine-specific)
MSNPGLFRYEWIWRKNNATGFLDAKKRPLNNYESILVFGKSLPNYYPQMREGKAHKRGSRPGTGATQIHNKFSRDRKETKSSLYYPQRIIDFPVERKRHGHPTQKPVALMEYLMRTYTQESETVLDNCMGSGTTGVACVNLNRNFIGIELSAEYFGIAEKRIMAARLASVRHEGRGTEQRKHQGEHQGHQGRDHQAGRQGAQTIRIAPGS